MSSLPVEQLADEFERLFKGRKSAFSEQSKEGRWFPVRREFERADLKRHFEGSRTYGLYLVNEENLAHLLCWDIDMPDNNTAAQQAVRSIKRALCWNLKVDEQAIAIEWSGYKGYHVWLFLAYPVRAGRLRDFGKHVEQLAGVTCEVYPKGDVPEGGFGNLVKLPLAIHRKTGNRTQFVDPVTWGALPALEYLRFRRPLGPTDTDRLLSYAPERVRKPLNVVPGAPLLPCAEHILENGVDRGSRTYAIFATALALKRAGRTEDEAVEVLLDANARFTPPADERRITSTVASVYRRNYEGFDCRRDFLHDGIEPHCLNSCPRYQPDFGPARSGEWQRQRRSPNPPRAQGSSSTSKPSSTKRRQTQPLARALSSLAARSAGPSSRTE